MSTKTQKIVRDMPLLYHTQDTRYDLGMASTSKDKALSHFKKADPKLFKATKMLHHKLPDTLAPKRTRAQLFDALVDTVISQQLSVKAADTIYARVKGVCKGSITPQALKKARVSSLQGAGLSAAKVKTLTEVTGAVDNGLDLLALGRVSAYEASEKLRQVWGIGSWTAEMFLLFGLGHHDIFSAKDLGLVRSMERIYGLPRGSEPAVYLSIAEAWAPYRSFASLLLWRLRDATTLPQSLSKSRK